MNKQVSVALAILLVALATTGFTYSHWIDSTNVRTRVNMANLSILIQNQNTTLTWTMSPNNHTLKLSGTIPSDQTKWTGIIIKNNGTTPATITYAITTNNSEIWEKYFTHKEYFYGPYSTDPPANVWNNAPTLPPLGNVPLPLDLLPQERMVAWQNITRNDLPPPFTIEITVAYTATWSTWTDMVSVIYTLTYP
jgi:hypothetical protein